MILADWRIDATSGGTNRTFGSGGAGGPFPVGRTDIIQILLSDVGGGSLLAVALFRPNYVIVKVSIACARAGRIGTLEVGLFVVGSNAGACGQRWGNRDVTT